MPCRMTRAESRENNNERTTSQKLASYNNNNEAFTLNVKKGFHQRFGRRVDLSAPIGPKCLVTPHQTHTQSYSHTQIDIYKTKSCVGLTHRPTDRETDCLSDSTNWPSDWHETWRTSSIQFFGPCFWHFHICKWMKLENRKIRQTSRQTNRLAWARVNNIAASACVPFRFVNNAKYDVGIWCVVFQA